MVRGFVPAPAPVYRTAPPAVYNGPPGSYLPAPLLAGGLPSLDPRISYECYATLPLIGGVPFDVAEAAGQFVPVARYWLLGGSPHDWQRGFRLSGPGGTAIRLAQQYFPGQSPLQQGLPAWICTQTRGGPQLLTRQMLDSVFETGWIGGGAQLGFEEAPPQPAQR